MSKAVLRISNSWTPITRQDARQLGISVKPLAPTHVADELGVVLDQSSWLEMAMGRWMVAYQVVDQRGQPVIAEVRIFPLETGKRPPGQWSGTYGTSARVPPGGITARLLREIRKGPFRNALREIIARWTKELTAMDLPIARPQSPAPKKGRKGRPDIELARIAAAYEKAYLASQPATALVAETFHLSSTQARDAVHRARVRGLLSPASKQGQGGGTLTETAKALLNEARKQKGRGTHGTKR